MRTATDETPASAPVRRTARRLGARLNGITGRIAHSTVGEHAARAGLATRGIAYVVMGYLVARVAAGALGSGSAGQQKASGQGVVQALLGQPGGRVALAALAVGLALYALFSLLDAVRHHDDETPVAKRWGDRFLSGWGVLVYGVFAGYCLRAAVTGPRSQTTSGQAQRQDARWSAEVLRWPAGWFWLGALGAVLLITSAFMLSRAVRRNFRTRLHREQMGPIAWSFALITGTVGNLGRCGLFAIVGWFVITAAIENDPQRSRGVDGSIRQFAGSAPGPYLLSALAGALVCYGAYVVLEARYREV